MRNETEILDLILGIAKEDDRIRAVLMSGSRANPDCPKDAFQDYDIIYYVTDVAPFYNNTGWITAQFGRPAIMQMPEAMTLIPPDGDGSFVCLMIFEDGNRIDLCITKDLTNHIADGEPAVVLLDKDGFLPDIRIKPDFWYIKKPTQQLFSDCCNEFWWCLNNVGKGIARDELPYAMGMFHDPVRDMLNRMLEWHIGTTHDFQVSAGKMGKYFKKYLSKEFYRMYAATYCGSDYREFWSAVFTACELFREAALDVAKALGFTYNHDEDRAMMTYLTGLKERP